MVKPALVETGELPLLVPEVTEQAIALVFIERIRVVFDDGRPLEFLERDGDVMPIAAEVARLSENSDLRT